MSTFFLQILNRFISTSTENNITIESIEVFVSDPTEAVSRLKNSQQRIIFALCYPDTCPLIACAVSC